MAEETQKEETTSEAKQRSLLSAIMVPAVVGIVAGALGVTTTIVCPGVFGLQKAATAAETEIPLFVYSFGDVVANLNEDRMNRYLRLGISLMIEGTPKYEKEFITKMEKEKSVLTSWLFTYLADLGMDDVRGAAGQNRLRREIRNAFNETLFPDGQDRIHDVLFEEFSIQ